MKTHRYRLLQSSQFIDRQLQQAVTQARREQGGISKFEKVKRRLLARKKPV